MPSAAILIADGTEEMEFTIAFDTLVRAGVACRSLFVPDPASVTADAPVPLYATCSRGLRVVYDATLDIEAHTDFDALIIPGGAKGAETLSKTLTVQRLVREYLEEGKLVGMICAGSLTALTAQLPRQPLTSHPSVKTALENDFDYSEDPVVISGKLVTSRGPGTTFPFALTLVSILCGEQTRAEVQAPMVFPTGTPF
ncbi:DJ-1 protein [Mycena indigotica]|uniref:D-lactate dehydratase n=1 Tax=Mycena indigotica TaxID=2126181 RepID=A0A8H6S2M6_9AGAR|nr:DJ-1 protein [Mycena indigotica]KAF7291322.1 DJ-1 protein [Mycena indigotica]